LYPLTEHQAKPLLNVAGKPIIQHIVEKIEEIEDVTEVFVVTNHRFHEDFRIWLNHFNCEKKITIINDGTLSNDDRLGAVGDLNFVLKEKDINEDLLVIAGDNLFGFSLQDFIEFHKSKSTSVVAFHDLKDIEVVRGKYGVGILEVDKVMDFQEKPREPLSSLASTACYVFSKNDLKVVEALVAQGKADNPGDLVKWLVKQSAVHGFVFDDYWFDIGSFDGLKEAETFFSGIVPEVVNED
jgi:glucose-1-phosphate thymidylyltransferase